MKITAILERMAHPPQRRCDLLEVTPKLAMRWLEECNEGNRPLSPSTLARYCRDQAGGAWISTAQPIVFDWNGNLLDGQHRLRMIVETGVPQLMYVATGEDPATFPAYDRGRGRTAGDALAMLGHKHYNALAAAAARLKRHYRGDAWSTTAAEKYVNVQDVIDIVQEFPSLVENMHRTNCVLVAHSLAAFLHFLFSEKDQELADWFFDVLAGRAAAKNTDGAFVIRERLIKQKAAKGKLEEKEVAALIVKAWNAQREGRRVTTIRWRSSGPCAEPFPEIA